MDGLVARYADITAAKMKKDGISPVQAVHTVFKEQCGGKGLDDEFRRAVLRELGRRGGSASAKAKKETCLEDEKRFQQMIRDARLLAFRRRDHLLPDP